MNRLEFQEWLNQFDEDTIIEIVYHTDGHGYYDQGGNATTETFNPDMGELYSTLSTPWCLNGHFEYNDFNTNQFVKPHHPYFGKKILTIGGLNQ
jgi:hypothetical protein